MKAKLQKKIDNFMEKVREHNPDEPEFIQAVEEVAATVIPFIEDKPKYIDNKILERMVEPERLIMFRVTWMDDAGEIQINRGYRVQMNSTIGPYKGGLRFHPSVNTSILKFLGFEQVLKNALTGLPLGGGKGGSDFDPKGKSDQEVMRFCQAFMQELSRHIGESTDVPAGDIGVGSREIGYLFGMYKKINNNFTGVLTGKGINWGGSKIRKEATGYGLVYFVQNMLNCNDMEIIGKSVTISGAGNVAQYAAEKIIQLGGKVLTMSDSDGYIIDEAGINREKLDFIMELKNNKRGRISEYVKEYPEAEYHKNGKPWSVKCDIAMPCATQNELELEHAEALIENGCICVAEGANMPVTADAIDALHQAKLLFSPGKSSNAGGVATSGLEMSQNSQRLSWTAQEVDAKLKEIMCEIHNSCVEYGRGDDGYVDYVKGANLAGFVKVADAMIAQGIV